MLFFFFLYLDAFTFTLQCFFIAFLNPPAHNSLALVLLWTWHFHFTSHWVLSSEPAWVLEHRRGTPGARPPVPSLSSWCRGVSGLSNGCSALWPALQAPVTGPARGSAGSSHVASKGVRAQRTDLWLPRGRGVGEGRTGSLGWADANYYTWNR